MTPKTSRFHRYQVKRDPQQIFTSYEELLRPREGEGPDLDFCQILDPGPRKPAGEDGEPDLSDLPWPTLVLGSGCTTVGSAQRLHLGRLKEQIRDELRELQHAPGPGADAMDVDKLDKAADVEDTVMFLEQLVVDRIGGMPDDIEETQPHDPSPGPGIARLVRFAMRLTRFYHYAKIDQASPPSRWDDDRVIAERTRVQAIVADHWEEILSDANELIRESGLGGHELKELVLHLLTRVRLSFSSNTVELMRSDVRLISEVTWHYLVQGTGIYPGWTDLLLSMLLELRSREPKSRRRPPLTNWALQPSTIAKLMRDPTMISWRDRLDPDKDELKREHFYNEAARLLAAEARQRREWGRSGSKMSAEFPPAVAFITGFDLELEMALWQLEEPFVVMVPVHVWDTEHGRSGSLAWLAYEATPQVERRPDDEYRGLVSGGTWRLQTSRLDPRLGDRPIVVRMSGCPLLELPRDDGEPTDEESCRSTETLRDLRAALGYSRDDARVGVQHAVVIDEYSAMQVSLADLHGSRPDDDSTIEYRGLPRELSGEGGYNPRYWMAFGVQVSDSAIRFRLFSQISKLKEEMQSFISEDPSVTPDHDSPVDDMTGSGPADDDDDEDDPFGGAIYDDDPVVAGRDPDVPPTRRQQRADAVPEPDPFGMSSSSGDTTDGIPRLGDEFGEANADAGGIAVNIRVDNDEASLLYWLGFSIVRDDCFEMVPALEHCRLHVENPTLRPHEVRGCPHPRRGTE